MKAFKYLLILSITWFSITGCTDEGEPILAGLSESEIIEGLKEALRVGTDTAVGIVSKQDGYFKDQAIKLLLPDEVNNSITTFKSKSINVFGLGNFTGEDIYTTGIPGLVNPLSSKEDELILGINRAAETAATEAAPIFWDAITGMTIEDANNILFGGVDTAATAYLNTTTRPSLFEKFEPKIENALQTVKIGNTSVVDKYESYITDYNAVLNQAVPTGLTSTATIASLMNMNAVEQTDLSAYSTDKGLDGLFLKVQDEERKIRFDPIHRVTSILEKVFGELD